MSYDPSKFPTPLVRLNDHPFQPEQHTHAAFIANHKVYAAHDTGSGPESCDGCQLEIGDRYCLQVTCSAWMRDDDTNVIFIEVLS